MLVGTHVTSCNAKPMLTEQHLPSMEQSFDLLVSIPFAHWTISGVWCKVEVDGRDVQRP